MNTQPISTRGIVLAAGSSRRFGAENKLLIEVDGTPLVRRTVETYLAAGLESVVVVTGYDADAVGSSVIDLPVRIVHNARFADGQSTSLAAGVRSLNSDVRYALIGVGDQPYLTAEHIRRLLEALTASSISIVAPRYGGSPGNPVVFASPLFDELCAVVGDVGGREVLRRHRESVRWVDFPDLRPGWDVDEPSDLRRLDRTP